jgi:HSP20 family protein
VAEKNFEERWGRFRDLVEHLFLEPGRGSLEADVVWYPATDAFEAGDEFVVRMDLSGVKKDEVRISLENGILGVHGVRRDTSPGVRKTFHKMEIAMGPFARSIQVPLRFAASEAKASYEGGILEIRLRTRAGAGSTQIHVESEE